MLPLAITASWLAFQARPLAGTFIVGFCAFHTSSNAAAVGLPMPPYLAAVTLRNSLPGAVDAVPGDHHAINPLVSRGERAECYFVLLEEDFVDWVEVFFVVGFALQIVEVEGDSYCWDVGCIQLL